MRLVNNATSFGTTPTLAFVIAAALASPAAHAQASFHGIGQMQGYADGTTVAGISANGALIAGTARDLRYVYPHGNQYVRQAFTWANGEFSALAPLDGTTSGDYLGTQVSGLSADGTIIVGNGSPVNLAGIMWNHGTPNSVFYYGPYYNGPMRVSANGRYLVGIGGSAGWYWAGGLTPYLWCAGACTSFDISDSGGVLVSLQLGNGQRRPALTHADGSTFLFPISLQDVVRITPDERAGVGDGGRWRDGVVTRFDLPFYPEALSSNGEIAAGASYSACSPSMVYDPFGCSSGDAPIWSERTGVQSVACVLSTLGVSIGGWHLLNVTGMSADGTILVGNGFNPSNQREGWIAVIPRIPSRIDLDDGSGIGHHDGGITIDDLLYFLAAFAQGQIVADVDDGSATGTPDGGVTIDDLLYYLARFAAGC